MIDNLVLDTRAVEKIKTSIKSQLNPFLHPPESNLSPHTQPKWFLKRFPSPGWNRCPGHVGGRMGRRAMAPDPFYSTGLFEVIYA